MMLGIHGGRAGRVTAGGLGAALAMVTAAGCGAGAVQATKPAAQTHAQATHARPAAKPTKQRPSYNVAAAKIMCISVDGLEQMTDIGGGTQIAALPAVKTQLRILGTFSRKLHVPEVAGAAATTVASIQQTGKMDPQASGTLGSFCASVPRR